MKKMCSAVAALVLVLAVLSLVPVAKADGQGNCGSPLDNAAYWTAYCKTHNVGTSDCDTWGRHQSFQMFLACSTPTVAATGKATPTKVFQNMQFGVKIAL